MNFKASQLQTRFLELRENKLFETFVIAVILFSALVIGAKTYDISPTTMRVMRLFETISAFPC